MIYAVNVVGNGTISSEVNATAMTVPTAPTGVVATYGNQSITLTWVTPHPIGGEPITNYTIIQGLTSGTETYYITLGVVNSFVDIGLNGTGLTNGQTYYYKVYAVNIAGNGTNSAEVNAVPKTTPNAPLSISTSAGSAVNQITLTWVAPNNGGSAITNYKIYHGTIRLVENQPLPMHHLGMF